MCFVFAYAFMCIKCIMSHVAGVHVKCAHVYLLRNVHKFTSYVSKRVGDLFVTFVTALSKNIHLLLHHCFQHFVELPVIVVPNPKVHHLRATQKGYAYVVCTIVWHTYSAQTDEMLLHLCEKHRRGKVEGGVGRERNTD